MINPKQIYKNFVMSRKFLKLLNFCCFEKIDSQELVIKPEEKCLLLNPHFDDEILGCAGLLINYPQNVHIVCLTSGNKGTREDDNSELVEIRKKEFLSVMRELGINSYEFLDIQDGKLIYDYEKFKQIDISDYDYIFLPNHFDNHKDHKAVSVLLKELLKEKKHKNSVKIAFYEIWSAMTLPNRYFDMTKIIKKKKDLIKKYSSQTKNVWFEKGILSLNAYRGVLLNIGWAEMFTVISINDFKKI